jgi:hypothetical protein
MSLRQNAKVFTPPGRTAFGFQNQAAIIRGMGEESG